MGIRLSNKLLIIAFFFPPVGEGGVQRTSKFVKYLCRKNWNVKVLTSDISSKLPIDMSLMKDIPAEVAIYKIKEDIIFRMINKISKFKKIEYLINHFLIPDDYILLIKSAYFAAKKIIISSKIPILYTTSSPYSTHIIGLLLKIKFGKNLFWVADFRDPWAHNMLRNNSFGTVRRYFELKMEKKILDRCDHIIHSTTMNRDKVIKLFNIPAKKVTTIYNGYDEDDFKENLLGNNEKTEKFNIAYFGNFYTDYNPSFFLHSIKDYISKNDNIRLSFVGNGSDWVRKYLKGENLEVELANSIECKDYVQHEEVVRQINKADLLLLFLPKYMDYCIPGKLFEYLRSGKTILALVNKEGETAKIIIDTNAGYVVEPEDEQGIKTAIHKIYQKWITNDIKRNIRMKNIMKFERNHLTDQLVKVFINGLECLSQEECTFSKF